MSRREPKRIRRLLKVAPDFFWCQRCEAWKNPAFFEREHPRREARNAHPTRTPATLVGVFGPPSLAPLRVDVGRWAWRADTDEVTVWREPTGP